MTVRNWKYTDISKIAEFEEKQMFPDRWTYNQLAESFLNDKFKGFLLETDDGEIVGTIALNFGLDEADLVNVLVAARLRKTGLATLLMQTALAECEKIELNRLFLEVRESNIPAIRLYEKFGFERISQRKGYYKDGETAVVMRKVFDYSNPKGV